MIGHIIVFIFATGVATISGWSIAQLEDTRYKTIITDELNKRQQEELVLIQEVQGQEVLSAQEFATDVQQYLVIQVTKGSKGDKGDKGDTGAPSTGDITGVTAGSGLTGGATSGDATLSFGPLTADWTQTGAFDILLGNASEVKILESTGDTYYATIEVGDLSADTVYTFSGATGVVLSSANYSTTLNSSYLQIANNLSDLGSVTSARTNLGLGSIATQNASAIAITGGTLSGITDYSQSSGNFAISGAGTLSTGTGTILLNGDTTIASGKTLAVTTADNFTVGGTKIPQTLVIPVDLTATILDQHVFVADASYQVTSVRCVYSVAALTSGTLQVRVNTGTDTPSAGTAQLTSTINLSTTVNTTYTGTLIGSPTTMSAGDRLSIDVGGTLTGLLGSCTIGIKRV